MANKITGYIRDPSKISGNIRNAARASGHIRMPEVELIPSYTGPYNVTPRMYAQSLDTDGKRMSDDVTVYEIPVTRTSNPQGGLTVLIG